MDSVVAEHAEMNTKTNGCCSKKGPGYATPVEAMSGPKESLIYVTCVYSGTGREKPDYLATVDVDPSSPSYSKIIHRMPVPYWVMNCIILGGIHAALAMEIDPLTAASSFCHLSCKAPCLHKVVQSEEIVQKTGLAYPHTSHCLASGDIMISCIGDKDGNAEGNGFLLLDSEFNVKGRWEKPGHSPLFGYDYWYQPRHNTMISTSLGAPFTFIKGFNPQHVSDGLYGRQIYVYSWPGGELKQTLDLGNTGMVPLEIRFLHEPSRDIGYVGCALSSNMVRFFKNPDDSWSHEVAISVKPLKVKNWILPEMAGLITDLLISLDDRYMYFVNWFHGDVKQYNIEDPKNPVLKGQLWVGTLLKKGSPVVAEDENGNDWQFDLPEVQGKQLRGGPQMIQLSLDGKRLYVTNSLFSSWDKQFYPELMQKGSHMLQIDVDTEKGGLAINPNFFVDFESEPDGPSLAHEMRYPGGDCTSDIWV
ncbi:hypothetical protein MKX01_019770 [Papaver californicum]|nr:hypothetical protein MKX01_019770 [Papaver californicum]